MLFSSVIDTCICLVRMFNNVSHATLKYFLLGMHGEIVNVMVYFALNHVVNPPTLLQQPNLQATITKCAGNLSII